MADILADVQSMPVTPAAGQVVLYPDTTLKQWMSRDDAGKVLTLHGVKNQSSAAQVLAASDTYVTGSNLRVPNIIQVGMQFRWQLVIVKTAAGLAAPIVIVRVGTAGAIADTARITFTQVAAQTAAVDTAWFEVVVNVNSVGAAGVIAGGLQMGHVLAATGFSTLNHNVMQVTSAGFDTTTLNNQLGLSINAGASSAWSVHVVQAEMVNG